MGRMHDREKVTELFQAMAAAGVQEVAIAHASQMAMMKGGNKTPWDSWIQVILDGSEVFKDRQIPHWMAATQIRPLWSQ